MTMDKTNRPLEVGDEITITGTAHNKRGCTINVGETYTVVDRKTRVTRESVYLVDEDGNETTACYRGRTKITPSPRHLSQSNSMNAWQLFRFEITDTLK